MLMDRSGSRGAAQNQETFASIEAKILADNSFSLEDVSPSAPCTIVVTPDGKWFSHPEPDSAEESAPNVAQNEAWLRQKDALFRQYAGFDAVAWDLSWYFLEEPTESLNQSLPLPLENAASLPASVTSPI
jgi:hypothetical protein